MVEEFFVYGGEKSMIKKLHRYAFLRDDQDTVEDTLKETKEWIASVPKYEMAEFVSELKDIRDKVGIRERLFYLHFGASNFKEFNTELERIEKAYSSFLPNGAAFRAICKEIDFTDISITSTPEEIEEALQFALQEFLDNNGTREQLEEEILKYIGDGRDTQEAVNNFIQAHLTLNESTGKNKKARFILSRDGKKVGLGKVILGYDLEKKKFILKTEDVTFSSDFKKKIKLFLGKIVNQKAQKVGSKSFTKKAFRETINRISLECMEKGTAKDLIEEAMRDEKSYDLYASPSSVIGYLGELRATAMLRHLTPHDKKNIMATGALKRRFHDKTGHGKGTEIPIDLICEEWGFQIKNYSLINGKVTFSNSAYLPYILSSRMDLSGTIYDILINLFGVYQYNQPFTNTRTEPRGLNEYIDMYNSIYKDNDSLFRQLKPIFDSRIPQMLKIKDLFSAKDNGANSFLSETVYFNTFFWINKKLVPSSYILNQLIEQFEKNTEKVVSSIYSISEPDRQNSFQKSPIFADKLDMLYMANKLKMHYEITIDLSDIE